MSKSGTPKTEPGIGSRRTTASAPATRSGVYTFSNVPADKDVIAIADEADQDEDDDDYQPVMVLDPDEVPAYTGVEANGIMGGAFGDLGGFSHTVSLCPLMSRDTDQRFREDNCGTFGVRRDLPSNRTGVEERGHQASRRLQARAPIGR